MPQSNPAALSEPDPECAARARQCLEQVRAAMRDLDGADEVAAELRYFIQGADDNRLVEACRAVVTTSPVPAGAYLWRLRDGRRGERLDL